MLDILYLNRKCVRSVKKIRFFLFESSPVIVSILQASNVLWVSEEEEEEERRGGARGEITLADEPRPRNCMLGKRGKSSQPWQSETGVEGGLLKYE